MPIIFQMSKSAVGKERTRL